MDNVSQQSNEYREVMVQNVFPLNIQADRMVMHSRIQGSHCLKHIFFNSCSMLKLLNTEYFAKMLKNDRTVYSSIITFNLWPR